MYSRGMFAIYLVHFINLKPFFFEFPSLFHSKVYLLHMPAPSSKQENGNDENEEHEHQMQSNPVENGPESCANSQDPAYYWSDAERPANCVERCRPVDADPELGLLLADGTRLRGNNDGGKEDGDPVDCVIFCTGYRYSFPFLESTGPLAISFQKVKINKFKRNNHWEAGF